MILLQQKYSNHVFFFFLASGLPFVFFFLLQIPWLNYVSVAKTMVNLWLQWFNNSNIVFGFIVKSLLIFVRVVLFSALAPPKPIIKRYGYLFAKLLL